MEKEKLIVQPSYIQCIRDVLSSNLPPKPMAEKLEDFHAGDLADALHEMNVVERKRFLAVLPADTLSDVLEYCDDDSEAARYLYELELKKRVAVLNGIDTERLVSVLKVLPSTDRADIIAALDESSVADMALLDSFPDSEIGCHMSTNYVAVSESLTVKEAMKSVIDQAAEHDNINTIFAFGTDECYCGAFELKDLIIAREGDSISELIISAFPFVYAWEPVDECIVRLKDYSADSIPILNEENRLIGVLTSQDLLQLVDDEMGEDYAKLAGLFAEEDLQESVLASARKRLPWLIVLLILGLLVSSVVGAFETVIQQLTVIICFQSLVLDMSGNVGTQSLAVTIRVLMDRNVSARDKLNLVSKELRVGALNGFVLGLFSAVFVGLYILFFMGRSLMFSFAVSGCIGLSLLIAMMISSLTGTVIPMIFKKLGIDPAVASGPLITTINDLAAVVTYYGLSWLLLINVFKFNG